MAVSHHPALPGLPEPEPEPVPVPSSLLYRKLPVGPASPFAGWNAAIVAEMSGPGASPWYRDISNGLDVRWRLTEVAPHTVRFDEDLRNRTLDRAFVGMMNAWSTTLTHTVQRTPELGTLQAAIQSALTPSLQMQPADGGGKRVQADTPGAQNAQLAMAEINQGAIPVPAGVSPPSVPTLRTGSAISLFRMPNTTGLYEPDASTPSLAPSLSSWVDVRDVVVDAARMQTRLVQNPDRPRFRPKMRWNAVMRHAIHPYWAVVADIQGSTEQLRPTQNGLSLEHNLRQWALPAWAIRLTAQEQLRPDLGEDTLEQQVILSARTNLAWYVPHDPRRWPLGERPNAVAPPDAAFPKRPPHTSESRLAEPAGAETVPEDALASR